VLNFGLPALSGETASQLDTLALENGIKQALQRYEPRILPSTLEVKALMRENELDHHNVVSIEIRGTLWAHPLPIELLLRTDLDLETGEARIHDLGAAGTR
jgi:type VI secretion system protein ImpF